MPSMIQSLAMADGNTLTFDANVPGGYTLQSHSTNATSLQKIKAQSWDFVVLQDQSQVPSFPWAQVQTEVFPFAETLVDSIRSANACAIPVFFNTWGRQNGDPQWDSINTFEKMNDRLFRAYAYMAEQNSTLLAPIGMAFKHIKQDPAAVVTFHQLYSPDGSHPSSFGSYLAACVFYESLFAESSVGNTFRPNAINANQAEYLQTVANHVLNNVDSIESNFAIPLADFEFQQNTSMVTVENHSKHAFTYSWSFGDGFTSTAFEPTYNYTTSGDFIIELTATYCNRSSTHKDTVEVRVLAVQDLRNTEKSLTVFPNPTKNQFEVKSASSTFQLFSIGGEFLGEHATHTSLRLNLPVGTYLVKTENATQRLIKIE